MMRVLRSQQKKNCTKAKFTVKDIIFYISFARKLPQLHKNPEKQGKLKTVTYD
jgi:hypothetical protein